MDPLSQSLFEFVSDSPQDTLRFGTRIARGLAGGVVVALVGPLGAGKTLLVKGIASANAGKPCEVTSPTFTLIQEYPGRLHIYHLDVYRLHGANDPLLLGLDEMVRSDSAVMIEWADRVAGVLPRDTLWIEIEPREESQRVFRLRAEGPVSQRCLQRVADTPLAVT